MSHRALLAALLGSILVTGCASTETSAERASAGPWLTPSPSLRQEIERQAQRLPWTHGMDRVELVHWFASVGEPAYPTLLSLAADPRPDVAGAALAALGATGDARLVEPLRALPWPPPDQNGLALERARTAMRLGDWSLAPNLIEGLKSERLMTRALSIQALGEATNERFGYDAHAEPEARAEAVARWEAWWARVRRDPLR